MDDERVMKENTEESEERGRNGGERNGGKNTYLVLFQQCYQTLNESENGVLVVLLD